MHKHIQPEQQALVQQIVVLAMKPSGQQVQQEQVCQQIQMQFTRLQEPFTILNRQRQYSGKEKREQDQEKKVSTER